MFGKLVAGVTGGIMVAAVGVPFIGMVLSPFDISLERYVVVLAILFIIAMIIVAATAGRTAKAWRYVLITAASFSLGLSLTHLLSGSTPLHGGESTDFVGLMTFFAGVVLLLIGLLVGRDTITYDFDRAGDDTDPK